VPVSVWSTAYPGRDSRYDGNEGNLFLVLGLSVLMWAATRVFKGIVALRALPAEQRGT
jgi:hypothetical protein